MSFMGYLKEKYKAEAEKLKGKSLKDKLWYIWEYYKFPIIGVVGGAAIIISIGSAIYSNRFDTAISCVIINSRFSNDAPPSDDYFDPGFREYLGLDPDTVISVDSSMSVRFDDKATQFDYAALAKITALTASGDMDVMISNPECIDHYGSMGAFADLSALLPEDLYSQLKDKLYYVTDESGSSIACGVNLSDAGFEEKTGLILENPIFSLMNGAAHTDTGIELLRYIFEL